jgi:hypothetical protein
VNRESRRATPGDHGRTRPCAFCGTRIGLGDRFCMRCGQYVGVVAAEPGPSGIGRRSEPHRGERG